MAMNVMQAQPKQTNDTAARSYSAHVNLSKRGQDIAKRETPIRVTAPEMEANGFTPSPYTVLVSRIENRGPGDPTAVDELSDWLEQRLPRISEQSRRRIAALPEYAAAGLTSDFNTLPRQIAARLRDGSVTQAMLALLKHPVFAAYMKDQQMRVAIYGPKGLLRAS